MNVLRRLWRSSSGMNLVELNVTIVLISIASVTGLALFSAGYDTIRDTGQRLEQINQGEKVLGAINALFTASQPTDLGLSTAGIPALTGPGGVSIPATPAGMLPGSLSGKQLTFASGARCYRIFYRQNTIWLAVANNCPNLAQSGTGLQRGPEQFSTVFTASSALYDPVLDLTANSGSTVRNSLFTAYPLAQNVSLISGKPLFSYKFLDLSSVALSATGNLGDNVPFYSQGLAERASIVAVEIQFAINSQQPGMSAQQYRQTLFIGQSCQR